MAIYLADICGARFPMSALPHLAGLRCAPGITALFHGEDVWLCWPVGREEVLRQVWPLPGVQLFGERDGLWYQLGDHLPCFTLPDWSAAKPLADLLFPAPFTILPAPALRTAPVMVRLVPAAEPRATTAMLCSQASLHACLESMTKFRFENWTAARCGQQILVRGENLFWLPDAPRFWGKHVLLPLGYRLTPLVPEAVLRTALGAEEDYLLLEQHEQVERIPLDAFAPLSRATMNLAVQAT